MELDSNDLGEVVSAVWSGMLGVDMVATAAEELPQPDDDVQLTGCIHMSEGHDGSLLVRVPEPVAKELAAAMFALEVDELADDDVVDALGEVTNMIGGNVKALVGGDRLSLPSVTRGHRFDVVVPGSTLQAETDVDSCGHHSRVLLLAHA
ncbi:MAG: chemotaxis protein CheX [Acidimicrobiia bacterium]